MAGKLAIDFRIYFTFRKKNFGDALRHYDYDTIPYHTDIISYDMTSYIRSTNQLMHYYLSETWQTSGLFETI